MNAISIINIAGTEAEIRFWLVIDIALQKPVVARPLPRGLGDICLLSLGSQCFGIPGLSSRFLALKPHSAKTAPDLGLDRDRSDDLVYMFAIYVLGLVALAGSWVGHQSGLALWACHSPVNHVCPAGAARRFDVRTFLIRNAYEVDWLIHHASLHPLTAKAQRLLQTNKEQS